MGTAKNCGAWKLYCLSLSPWGTLALTCFFQYKHNSMCVWFKCATKRIASLPIVPSWGGTNWTIQWHMLVTLLHALLECFQILWCLQLGSLQKWFFWTELWHLKLSMNYIKPSKCDSHQNKHVPTFHKCMCFVDCFHLAKLQMTG